ncbi:hypothetical protein PAEPH01_0928 [Pancytospora epiphaga]|nr:hypothetical protein PAEPH01_0928 [Pancytospora epiphaga]
MANTEAKRKSVPGSRELVMQVRSISDNIQSIEDEIRASLEKLTAILEANRANSKKAGLLADFKKLNEEMQGLRTSKKGYFEQLNNYKNDIERLKASSTQDKNTVLVKNPEELEKRMEDLNMRLIAEASSVNEEKKIAAELLQLRSMKAKLGDIEDSRNKIRNIEGALGEIRTKIGDVTQKIAEVTLVKDRVKAELDKASAVDKIKSPEVVKIESKIASLKAQKQDMIAQKNAKKDAIRALEAEWAAFEVILLEQRGLEEKKDAIKKVIQEYKNKKDTLTSELSEYDPKVFDMLHYSVSLLKGQKIVSLDISLVDSLLKHGISVPYEADEIDKTLKQLDDKKGSSTLSFESWSDKINNEMAKIDEKIQAETKRLNELPPTDYDVLKKGGRVRKA